MSRVRKKYCLALVSRHSKAGEEDETFAKILGMDDPLSKTLNTSQRGILPAHDGIAGTQSHPHPDAQHLDISRAVVLHQNQGTAHQSMEAVAEWI